MLFSEEVIESGRSGRHLWHCCILYDWSRRCHGAPRDGVSGDHHSRIGHVVRRVWCGGSWHLHDHRTDSVNVNAVRSWEHRVKGTHACRCDRCGRCRYSGRSGRISRVRRAWEVRDGHPHLGRMVAVHLRHCVRVREHVGHTNLGTLCCSRSSEGWLIGRHRQSNSREPDTGWRYSFRQRSPQAKTAMGCVKSAVTYVAVKKLFGRISQ